MDLLTSVAARSPPFRKELLDSHHFPHYSHIDTNNHTHEYIHISPRIHHTSSFPSSIHAIGNHDEITAAPYLRTSGSTTSLNGLNTYHSIRRVSLDEAPPLATVSPVHHTTSASTSSATSPSPHLIHHSSLHSPASPYMLYPPSPLHPHAAIPPLHPSPHHPPSPLHMRTQPPSPLHSRSVSPSSAFRSPQEYHDMVQKVKSTTTTSTSYLPNITQLKMMPISTTTPTTTPSPTNKHVLDAAAHQAQVNAEADVIMAAVEAENEARELKKKRGRGSNKEKAEKQPKKSGGKGKKKDNEDDDDSVRPSKKSKHDMIHMTDEERKKAKHREIDAHRRNREANALTTLQNLAFPDHPGRPEKAAVLIRSGQLLLDAQRETQSLRDKLDEMTRAHEMLLAEKKRWEEEKIAWELDRERTEKAKSQDIMKIENKEDDESDIIKPSTSLQSYHQPYQSQLQRAFELGAASTMYQSMFVNASVIMCVMNTLGQCVDVNQRFVEKSGWARSDVIGRSLTSITAYSPLWTGSNDKVPRKMSSDELPVVKSPSSLSSMELPPYADTLKAILRLFKGKEQCVTCVHRMVDGWGCVVAVKANTWLVYEQGKIKYGICATTDENVTVVSESPSTSISLSSPATTESGDSSHDSVAATPISTSSQ